MIGKGRLTSEQVNSISAFEFDDATSNSYEPKHNRQQLLTFVNLTGTVQPTEPAESETHLFDAVAQSHSHLPPPTPPSSPASLSPPLTSSAPNSLNDLPPPAPLSPPVQYYIISPRTLSSSNPAKSKSSSISSLSPLDSNTDKQGAETSIDRNLMDRLITGHVAGSNRPPNIVKREALQELRQQATRRNPDGGHLLAPAAQHGSQHLPGNGRPGKENHSREDVTASSSNNNPSRRGREAKDASWNQARPNVPTQPPQGPLPAAAASAKVGNTITPNDVRGIPADDDFVPESSTSIVPHKPQVSADQKGKQKEKYVNPWETDSDTDSDESPEEEEETKEEFGARLLKAYNEGKMTEAEMTAAARERFAPKILHEARVKTFDRLFMGWYDKPVGEELSKLRNRPGTDMTSNVYQELAKPRLVKGVEAPEPWSVRPPDDIPDEGYEEINPDENWHKVRRGTPEYYAQWDAYNASPAVYPHVVKGKLKLRSTPAPGVLYDEQPFPYIKICGEYSELAPENRGPYRAQWWFSPTVTFNRIQYLEDFYIWLNCIPEVNRWVNIYHKAFFDGTASPDGAFGMFIQDIKHLQTPRDMKRKRTQQHWHETAAGYIHNKQILLQEEQAAKLTRQEKWQRDAEAIQVIQQQPIPKAIPGNVYLRPVEFHDSPELVRLVNWYMENSPVSPETQPISEADARDMVQDARNTRLPFIVAVQRTPKGSDAAETVLGYAFLKSYTDFVSANCCTLEMRVYVDHKHKKLHIGRSLIDRLLAMRDIMHSASAAHVFEASGHNFTPEGPSFATVICPIAYPPGKAANYAWIKEWLIREFRFREQGLINGGRFKFDEAYVSHFSPLLACMICCTNLPFPRLDVALVARPIGRLRTNRNPRTYIS